MVLSPKAPKMPPDRGDTCADASKTGQEAEHSSLGLKVLKVKKKYL